MRHNDDITDNESGFDDMHDNNPRCFICNKIIYQKTWRVMDHKPICDDCLFGKDNPYDKRNKRNKEKQK